MLLEHSIGDRSHWDADYAGFARDKARIGWKYGIDSHRIQASGAHRLQERDTLLWGSVCLDGIVVGASGAEAWYDEAFATCIAANLRAIAKQDRDAARKGGSLRAGVLPD